jgi:hypothetical protein
MVLRHDPQSRKRSNDRRRHKQKVLKEESKFATATHLDVNNDFSAPATVDAFCSCSPAWQAPSAPAYRSRTKCPSAEKE